MLLEPAVEEFNDLTDEPVVIALGGQLARAYLLAEDNGRAIAEADRVLATAENADLGAIVADTLVTKGTALAAVGRTTEGLALVTGGQALAEALGLGATVVRATINRTSIQAARDPRAGLETARAALPLARRLGMRHVAAICLLNGAEDALRTGDWSWALGELDAALADEPEAVDRLILLEVAANLRALRGEPVSDLLDEMTRLVAANPRQGTPLDIAAGFAAFAAGRFADARAAWHRVAALSTGNLAEALARAARAALWAGDHAGAREDLASLDAAGAHGPAIDADRITIQAGIAALDGRPADAQLRYRDAVRRWRDLGLAWDEALIGIDMATLLDPSDPEVRASADAARDILVRLGATPFVERLDTALAGAAPRARGKPAAEAPERSSTTAP